LEILRYVVMDQLVWGSGDGKPTAILHQIRVLAFLRNTTVGQKLALVKFKGYGTAADTNTHKTGSWNIGHKNTLYRSLKKEVPQW
jgi:hypothetical protein